MKGTMSERRERHPGGPRRGLGYGPGRGFIAAKLPVAGRRRGPPGSGIPSCGRGVRRVMLTAAEP
jgi:hypothetical protein